MARQFKQGVASLLPLTFFLFAFKHLKQELLHSATYKFDKFYWKMLKNEKVKYCNLHSIISKISYKESSIWIGVYTTLIIIQQNPFIGIFPIPSQVQWL